MKFCSNCLSFVAACVWAGLVLGCGGVGMQSSGGAAGPTAALSAAPVTIAAGNSAMLTWTTTNATLISINQGIGNVAGSGSMKVSPSTSTQYTLTATGSGGSMTAVATVTVQAPPTATLSASPGTIAAGNHATLTWATTNASSVSINQGIGTVATSGSLAVNPTSTTQYTLTATGSGGSVTAVATVTVQASTPTATLSASPSTIIAGNHAALTWATTNATAVSIDQGIGTVAASGSTTVSPAATTQYTLTATGSGGSASAVATVTVQASPPTATLTASPATITAGNSSTLSWTTTNANAVSINQGIGAVASSGSTAVSPTSTTQYTLTATGSSTVTSAATVTVNSQGTPNSPISHLIIVMMQNHSLDNMFGTFPGANGLDASLPSYHQVDAQGNTVSPTLVATLATADLNHDQPTYASTWNHGSMDKFAYTNGDLAMEYYDTSLSGLTTDGKTYGIGTLWSYAQQYALADNFFMSAMNSEPSQELYMVAATVDNNNTASALPFYDNCSAVQQKKGGGLISIPLTDMTVGDQLTGAQVPWVWYQENFVSEQSGTCTNYVPQENVFQYFTSTENSSVIQDFTMASFNSVLSNGTLPSVVWITPEGAHDMHPGSGNILDGIEWLDEFVKSVKSSSEWQNTAIVVLFDEGGGWYDHVPPPQLSGNKTGLGGQGLGMRVPVIVISPYAKTNYISHQQMDFVSILRFIQWNWNLGQFPGVAQAAREAQSGNLCDLLTSACGSPAGP